MVSLVVLFWIFIVLFAFIGAMRGMAKEILVTFSVIVALFLILLLELYFPPMRGTGMNEKTRFWVETTIIVVMVFFGYQTPLRLGEAAVEKLKRQRFQDILLGFIFGAINGYFIAGSLWSYMDKAGYFPDFITSPKGTALGQIAETMLRYMPPEWLVAPWIYFAVAVAFLLVLWLFV